MAVKTYGIHDQWTDLNKLNIVEIKSENGEVDSVKINGEDSGGGGGESDFSTAKVTLINNGSPDGYKISLPTLTDENGIDFSSDITVSSEVVVQVPLYKGKLKVGFAIFNVIEGPATVSGDIFIDDDFDYLLITGDGTFTATASPNV